MFGDLLEMAFSDVVFRVDHISRLRAIYEKIGLTLVEQLQIDQLMLEVVDKDEDDLSWLCDLQFNKRENSDTDFGVGRFSDGSWPVFYTALEADTAAAEVAFHKRREVAEGRYPAVEIVLDLLNCDFSGNVLDLRNIAEVVPELLGEEAELAYPRCREVAAAILQRDMHGFLTRSARRREGTNLPVLRRDAVSSPRIIGEITIRPPTSPDAEYSIISLRE